MLIDEKVSRRVDSCGRISLPKHLRTKFNMDVGEELEFFTFELDGKDYICLAVKEPEEGQNP